MTGRENRFRRRFEIFLTSMSFCCNKALNGGFHEPQPDECVLYGRTEAADQAQVIPVGISALPFVECSRRPGSTPSLINLMGEQKTFRCSVSLGLAFQLPEQTRQDEQKRISLTHLHKDSR